MWHTGFMTFLKWSLIVLLIYMTYLLLTGTPFLFIDNFNLVMHEAGHIVLMLFGRDISFLGGTLMQLFVPLLCGAVLILQQSDWFGGVLCAWWLGENLVNVGIYMSDARSQILPLIGGEHDWTYLFSAWGVLDQAESIGFGVKGLGILVMAAAIGGLVFQLVQDKRNPVRQGTYYRQKTSY